MFFRAQNLVQQNNLKQLELEKKFDLVQKKIKTMEPVLSELSISVDLKLKSNHDTKDRIEKVKSLYNVLDEKQTTLSSKQEKTALEQLEKNKIVDIKIEAISKNHEKLESSLSEVREVVYKMNSDLQLLGIAKMHEFDKIFEIMEIIGAEKVRNMESSMKFEKLLRIQKKETKKIQEELESLQSHFRVFLEHSTEKNSFINPQTSKKVNSSPDDGYFFQLEQEKSNNSSENSNECTQLEKNNTEIYNPNVEKYNNAQKNTSKKDGKDSSDFMDKGFYKKKNSGRKRIKENQGFRNMPIIKGFLKATGGGSYGKPNSELFEKPSFESLSSGFSIGSSEIDYGFNRYSSFHDTEKKHSGNGNGLEIRISRQSIIKFKSSDESIGGIKRRLNAMDSQFHEHNRLNMNIPESSQIGFNNSPDSETYFDQSQLEISEKNGSENHIQTFYGDIDIPEHYSLQKIEDNNIEESDSHHISSNVTRDNSILEKDFSGNKLTEDSEKLIKIDGEIRSEMEILGEEELLTEVLDELIESMDPYSNNSEKNEDTGSQLVVGDVYGTKKGSRKRSF
ncbi:hypothetical protein AYI68_g8230 [Smittium mucronatum]|uniref:Uncharacterized protein n=1 Tax=Smittium mucronatum TaxID=133383 RepID=A0A1R0GLG8_9FUNG|nr:hypothetical protein AYI68_g8230 [Smittium mucronatum]